jgi:hypothetical protein
MQKNNLQIQHSFRKTTQNIFHNIEPIFSLIFNVTVAFACRTNARDTNSYFPALRPLILPPFILVDTFYFAAKMSSLFVSSLVMPLFLPQLQTTLLIVETGLRSSRIARDKEAEYFFV